ncbi:MAG: FIST signal transduction protein [Acidimicrobiales bacterium]
MRNFAAGHSEHPVTIEAAAEVLADLSERLQGDPELAVIFAAGSHRQGMADVSNGLRELVGVKTVIGVSASGVVSGGREVESAPGLSVWVGDTGPARPIRLEAIDSGRTILGLPGELEPGSVLVLLADPFSFPVDTLLEAIDAESTGIKVVGGLASAGRSPNGNELVLNGSVHTDGAVGVVLEPGRARPLVSHGCRPIGQPWVITDGSGQMIRQLGGRTALDRLQPIIDSLSREDRALAAKGLFVGIVANEQVETFEQGDFLIRSLLGVDRPSGALALGGRIKVGQTVQFHVRDPAAATQNMYDQLTQVHPEVQGSLLFTCTGRGTNMFTEPHHDAQIISDVFADVANAGMFCAGEIGPVGERNAVHGFTATMLLF